MATVTDYTAPPTVARFMQSNAPVRLLLGPVGSGKSVGDCMEIARRAQEQAPNRQGIRKTRWVVVRNTYRELTDTTLKTWLEWFPDGVAGRWVESSKTFHLRFGDVQAEVLFRALDTPDDVNRLLSLELTGGFINEAREVPIEIVTALRSRCGRYPSKKEGGPTWFGIIMDTNPPPVDHWIYEKFEDEKPAGWEIFKQPGGLEPNAENIENLPPNYYQDMMEGADSEWVNVHVHAKYGRSKAGKPVYENSWQTDFHTASGLLVMPNTPVVIGIDFGRTPAAAFFQKDTRGRVLMLDEITTENMGLELFIEQKIKPMLTQRYLGVPVACGIDPSGFDKGQLTEKCAADMLKAARLPPVPRMSNRIPVRLSAVETLLRQQVDGKGMFLVDKERCPQAIAGFEHGYRYKKKKDGQYEEVPDKNGFSHLADGIQYGCQAIDVGASYALMAGRAREVESVSMRGWT